MQCDTIKNMVDDGFRDTVILLMKIDSNVFAKMLEWF